MQQCKQEIILVNGNGDYSGRIKCDQYSGDGSYQSHVDNHRVVQVVTGKTNTVEQECIARIVRLIEEDQEGRRKEGELLKLILYTLHDYGYEVEYDLEAYCG